ncbi:MAG: 50S ribosomal protein L3 [Candidatus Longimicrobiales bacterium M2_2A_002]
MAGVIGRKLGMTQLFDEEGAAVPVTVIQAGPCPVVQVKTMETDGYEAIQVGFGSRKAKHSSRAERAHAARAGLEQAPEVLREFRVSDAAEYEQGQELTVEHFEVGQKVKVTGTAKGRGFQGVVKRHGFAGRPGSHGHSMSRTPGSIGPGTDPSRVIKGRKMPGQMGDNRTTIRNLRVERVDAERNLIFLRGSVPGAKNATVLIRAQ